MSGAPPPYTGLATRLDRTMNDTTEATLGSRLAKAEDRADELDDEAQKLGECLYDLKTHVENVPLSSFRYPDTVRSLLDRAETLLEGRVEDVPKSRADLRSEKADLEAEVERLREALRMIGMGEYHKAHKMVAIAKDALDEAEDGHS